MSEELTREFVSLVERLMLRWGYTHTDGKIYAFLLLNGKSLTIEELTHLTGLSRSSISTSLSRLRRAYLVTIRKNGRTKLFSAAPAFLKEFLKQPREMLEREIVPMRNILEMLSQDASPEQEKQIEALLRDLNSLECILQKIIKMEEEESECIKDSF